MRKIGNFEITSSTVEVGMKLLELATREDDAGKTQFRNELLAASVVYVDPSTEIRVEFTKAPFREFIAQMNDVFLAALEENGFREASE